LLATSTFTDPFRPVENLPDGRTAERAVAQPELRRLART